jgi:hypothetical protein
VFSVRVSPASATQHGVYQVDDNVCAAHAAHDPRAQSIVSNIIYRADEQHLRSLCTDDGTVALVTSLVHMSTWVVGALLSLHDAHPLSCSTYYGVDAGGDGVKVCACGGCLCLAVGMIQLSLFFDCLLPVCSFVEHDKYVIRANEEHGMCEMHHSWMSASFCVFRCNTL